MLKSIFFLSGLFFSIVLKAQSVEQNLSFFTRDNDVIQNAVTSMFQDDLNQIWFTTYGDGVIKHNSSEFKSYKFQSDESNSLNSSIVYTAIQDGNKRIWAGTEVGLNKYVMEEDNFESIQFKNQNNFKYPIHAIESLNDSILLLGTHQNGLLKYNINQNLYDLIPTDSAVTLSNFLIEDITKTENSRFFIGTNYGLMELDLSTNRIQYATFVVDGQKIKIDQSIHSLLINENRLWVGTSTKGLIGIDLVGDNPAYIHKEFTDQRILSLDITASNLLLCATENDGLFLTDLNGQVQKNYLQDKKDVESVKSNSIWSVFVDDKSRIWLGYYNKGVDVSDPLYNKFHTLKINEGNSSYYYRNSVTGIAKDNKSRFWFSTFDGGVEVYDPKTKQIVNLSQPNNPIADGFKIEDAPTVFIDTRDNVWIGTWHNGIYFLENGSRTFKNFNQQTIGDDLKSNRIMSFDEDSKGRVWIGTFGGGLHSYDQNLNSFTHHHSNAFSTYNIESSNIRKVYVDQNDHVWIGTRQGLFEIFQPEKQSNYEVKKIPLFSKNKSKSIGTNNIVVSLFQDKEENLWIGTLGDGLYRYNLKSTEVNSYDTNQNFMHETVFSIMESKQGTIWITGNKGVSSYNDTTDKFRNYDSTDGLLSNKNNYNSSFVDHDLIYFGNTEGVNYVDPLAITFNPNPPNTIFTNLKINNKVVRVSSDNSPLNKPITYQDQITLNDQQSEFTIEFVGVNYTRNENNLYQYMLEGYDNEWIYSGVNNNASYSRLRPGKYIFRVKSANNDGVWNSSASELNITILPAWWESNTAYVFYVILIIGLTIIFYKVFRQRIAQKQLIEFQKEERRQVEELNTKKIQFFTNISHEFRTPLTLIMNPLEDIINNGHYNRETLLKKHKIIHKNTNRLMRLIDELMDFRKLNYGRLNLNVTELKLDIFILDIVNHFSEEALDRNISLYTSFQNSKTNFWADRSMLEKIIFNLLSNAFKATPDGGKVSIRTLFHYNGVKLPLVNNNSITPAVEIIIEDTGKGIPKENQEKIFERFFQSQELDKQYYGGTGIGLEVVKTFVELHKGKVEVESKIKKGTKFKLYFPIDRNLLRSGELTTQMSESEIISATSKIEADEFIESNKEPSKLQTLLIVEDNHELRTYLKSELRKEYKIIEAENGQIGLEEAKKKLPDLIITDVMMPEMDGLLFSKKLKQDINTCHIPILMLTAKTMHDDRIKGIESGADVYLKKPFSLKLLKSHLNQLKTSRQLLFKKYYKGVVVSENTTSLDNSFMNKILVYINENISDEKLSVETLATEFSMSRSKLYRKIKVLTGSSANEFVRKIRLEKAKELIEHSDLTFSEIGYNVGFSSHSYFTKCFKLYFGITPKEMRKES